MAGSIQPPVGGPTHAALPAPDPVHADPVPSTDVSTFSAGPGGPGNEASDGPGVVHALELPGFMSAVGQDWRSFRSLSSVRQALTLIQDHHRDGLDPQQVSAQTLARVASELGVDVETSPDSITFRGPEGEPVTFPLSGSAQQIGRVTERALLSLANGTGEELDFDALTERFLRALPEELGSYARYAADGNSLLDTRREAALGVSFIRIDGRYFAQAPNAESSAASIGIAHGSEILSIDGVSVANLPTAEFNRLLEGPSAEIEFRRGGETRVGTIERTDHEASMVQLVSVENGIAHLAVRQFMPDTAEELRELLEEVDELQGVVLDIRSNGGGVVDGAVDLVGLFREDHEILHYLVGPEDEVGEALRTGSDAPFADLPVVILADRGSASSSEILLSGMHGRAVFVGAPTHGKGIVQTHFHLNDGDRLGFTTAEMVGPLGAYHTRGYNPTVCAAGAHAALAEGSPLDAAIAAANASCERTHRLDDEQDVALAFDILNDPDLHLRLVQQGYSVAEPNPVWDPD